VRAAMKTAGADVLFRFFATCAEAVASFERRADGFTRQGRESTNLLRNAKNVA